MMNLKKLRHILRASASISQKQKLGLIGAAATFFAIKNVPARACMSKEADIFLIDANEIDQEKFADLISGSIGESSSFHKEFGYYADGVEEKTAKLPPNWRERSVVTKFEDFEIISPCLEDLCVSKMFAWRVKDIDWLRDIASHVKPSKFAEVLVEIEKEELLGFDRNEIDRRVTSAFGAFAPAILRSLIVARAPKTTSDPSSSIGVRPK